MINIDVYLLSAFTKWYFSTPISLNLARTEFYLYIMSGTKFDTTTFWNILIYLTGAMQIFCSKTVKIIYISLCIYVDFLERPYIFTITIPTVFGIYFILLTKNTYTFFFKNHLFA